MKKQWDLDVLSIGVALLSYLVAALASSGVFSGGPGGCGDFNLGCGFTALFLLVAGTLTGTVLALSGLARQRWRSVYGWIGLLLNGAPALVLGGWLLLVFTAH